MRVPAAGQRVPFSMLAALCLLAWFSTSAAQSPASSAPTPPKVAFLHGVASGAPLPTSIIIWTRITPRVDYYVIDGSADEIAPLPQTDTRAFTVQWPVGRLNYTVDWLVSENPNLSNPVQRGSYFTNATKDWTVKVDVTGLRARVQYYYGFQVGAAHSPVGRFRLQPGAGQSLQQLRYSVFTCSNWGWGYFNSYDYAAQLDLDLFIHVGDWLYEYGPQTYPNMAQAVRLGVFPYGLQPAHEMFKLHDYRMRHAHYRTDPGLQALMASAPLISIWDDHETTNDPYRDGAENHDPEQGEGDWEQRKTYAARAYHEWMPTRSGDYGTSSYIGLNITSTYTFGNLATLVTLEGRLTERTAQDPKAAGNSTWPDYNLRTNAIVGTTPPEQWNQTQLQRLEALAKDNQALISDPSRHLVGTQQINVVRQAAEQPTTWLVVAQTTNVNNMINDLEGAIEMYRDVDAAKADTWAQALYNVTHPNTTYLSYSSSPHLLHELGKAFNTTPNVIADHVAAIAFGRYGIASWTDPWGAYTTEREAFKAALAPRQGRAIVYGGDTHASFAGMLCSNGRTVGSEYSSPGVTSPDRESTAKIPLELIGTSAIAGPGDTLWADFRYKGFQYVTLTPEKHHVDWVWVTWGSPNYDIKCDTAFDHLANPSAMQAASFKQGVPAVQQAIEMKRNMTSCSTTPFRLSTCSSLPVPDRYNPAKLRWGAWAAGNDMQTSQFAVTLQ